MNNLVIANPERLDDQSFKITISEKDYEYQISEDKDVDKVIDKLNKWIERGPDSMGGLYDYIKRSFQLVGEYHEPVIEDELPMEEPEPEFELPSEGKDLDEVQSNELEFLVDIISNSEVNITLGEFSAVFNLSGNADDFEAGLTDLIKEEMTLKDRIDLNTFLVKELDTDNSVDIYNLSELVLDPEFEIVNSLDDLETDEESMEEPIEDTSSEEGSEEEIQSEEVPNEDISDEEQEGSDEIVDSQSVEGSILTETPELFDIEFDSLEDEEESFTLEDLLINEDFLNSLRDLGLSLFKFTNKDNQLDNLYFVGGVNSEDGSLYSLTYKMGESYITLDREFEDLSTNEYELSNIEDLSVVTNYIGNLLDLVYSRDLGENYE